MIKEAEKTNLSGIIILEDKEFKQLSSFILNQFGIKLPPNKKTLLQCRLQKRLRTLNYHSFKEYTDYIFSTRGLHEEVYNMIDVVSTNKTDFFREPVHFDFLLGQGLKAYLNLTGKNKLLIWSAGCSSGEEPYTLGMILKEFDTPKSDFDFRILATDISQSVLQQAVEGIYPVEKSQIIPFDLKKKYLLKGVNACQNKVRIISELRNKVDFRRYNLLSTDYSSNGKFDIIFCRNVLIYFEREVQNRILKQFCSILNNGGYLFLGHSESITGYSLPLQQIRPTIFIKTDY
jgi:chemotaxis protein methyltransferase CheR